MPYWMTKLSSLEKGSRRLCRVEEEETGLENKGQNLDISGKYLTPLPAYPGCICSWDFQQTNDNPQAGVHGALMRHRLQTKKQVEKKTELQVSHKSLKLERSCMVLSRISALMN